VKGAKLGEGELEKLTRIESLLLSLGECSSLLRLDGTNLGPDASFHVLDTQNNQ